MTKHKGYATRVTHRTGSMRARVQTLAPAPAATLALVAALAPAGVLGVSLWPNSVAAEPQLRPRAGPSISAAVQKELAGLVETYKHLHRNPELSYREQQTARFMAEALRKLGFEVTEGLGRYHDRRLIWHGYVALLRNGTGPTVMLRTDLDALPVAEETKLPYASRVRTTGPTGRTVGVMHACGHDMHMSVQLGAARVLSALRERWKGTLMLVGQPAEEKGAGAKAMLRAGVFKRFGRPDYALALHMAADLPAGRIGYRAGFALANVDSVDIVVRGRGGHGAYPHTTLDPVVLAARIVLALQTLASREINPIDPAVVTVGSIHGGSKHNIIPNEVTLQLTVRSYKPEVRKQLLDGIQRIAHNTARAAGVPKQLLPVVRVHEAEFTPATYNEPKLVERLVPVLRRALGSKNVTESPPVLGGEDFGRFNDKGRVPIAMFWLGAVDPKRYAEHARKGTPLPSLHSSQFAPLARPALSTGVTALVYAVTELAPAQ